MEDSLLDKPTLTVRMEKGEQEVLREIGRLCDRRGAAAVARVVLQALVRQFGDPETRPIVLEAIGRAA